eukprot:CAMPEP_0115869606 /NCGR_PEP_ID=MMETSP0287-20121206/21896_1 /TAXON_ID=412157 /ORGANISM="Chrysochromulina rotalis, Strain UIO044" /LENGTH=110 /DNA_ID=CAMNT_0003324299 /DNA_START=364 /DNA_END=696 /DNA_ORIENTATION=-
MSSASSASSSEASLICPSASSSSSLLTASSAAVAAAACAAAVAITLAGALRFPSGCGSCALAAASAARRSCLPVPCERAIVRACLLAAARSSFECSAISARPALSVAAVL